jgi:multiple sugar transport system permease protein
MVKYSFNWFLTYTVLAIWTVVSIFPVYWVAVTSFKAEKDITEAPRFLPFVDFMPSLDAWRFILSDPQENLLQRFANSVVVGLVSTLLTMLIAALAIYAVTRFRRTRIFSDRFLLGILALRLLPPVAIVLPLYVMSVASGMHDTRSVLVLVYTAVNLPVAVWLLRPALGSLATPQEESAMLDGASHVMIFFSILLPMLASNLVAAGLLVFLLCWNEYMFAAYLATDHAMTVPTWLIGQMSIKEAQIGSEAEEWAHFSAATVLMLLPVIAFSGLIQRLLAKVLVWR